MSCIVEEMEKKRRKRKDIEQQGKEKILNVDVDHALDLIEATININYEDGELDLYWNKMNKEQRMRFITWYFGDKNFIETCQCLVYFAQGNDTPDKNLFYKYKKWINRK